MKSLMILPALALAATGAPQVTFAQAGAAKPGACAGLVLQWDSIEKELAERQAEGLVDNSAPRATLREMQNSNDLSRAQMILTMMQSGRCSLPDSPPRYIVYFSNALACQTARIKGTKDAPECVRSSWKKITDK